MTQIKTLHIVVHFFASNTNLDYECQDIMTEQTDGS